MDGRGASGPGEDASRSVARMGTWGSGAFENDAAADLVADLAEGGLDLAALRRDTEAPGQLDAGTASEVLALVELAAAGLEGRPSPVDGVDVRSFAASLGDDERRWLHEQGVRATAGPEQSELFGLWDEADELEQWLVPALGAVEVVDPDREPVVVQDAGDLHDGGVTGTAARPDSAGSTEDAPPAPLAAEHRDVIEPSPQTAPPAAAAPSRAVGRDGSDGGPSRAVVWWSLAAVALVVAVVVLVVVGGRS